MFSIVTLVPALVTGIYAMLVSSETLRTQAVTTQSTEAKMLANNITSFLSVVKGDLLFLSQSPLMNDYLNLRKETLPNVQLMLEEKRQSLEKEFLAFSRNRRIYYQIRYLDKTGQEIARVDSNGLKSWIVEREKLQNKSDRYYFKKTMRLFSNRIFVSPLDLNRERGEIEVPHKPVIRYAVSVYDDNDAKAGIVIINIDANQFLRPLDDVRLINQDGYFANHPDPKKCWGGPSDLDSGYSLDQEYPQLATKIRGKDGIISTPALTLSHLQISVSGSADDWILIVQRDTDEILRSIVAFRITFIVILIMAVLIAFVFALLFSAKITSPIEHLTRLADAISKGELINHHVSVKDKGEIGQLAQAFERMRVSMIKSFERLRKQSKL